jgi:hypothetical protein
MPTKKNFSAISDFLTPKEAEVEEIKVQPSPKQAQEKTKVETRLEKKSNQSTKTSLNAKSNDPIEEGFIRWTTYINPKYKRILKLMAVEGDTEIYKLLDALLEKEFKKK